MDIISYNEFEVSSKMKLYLRRLSKIYNKYKETYQLPNKIKGKNNPYTLLWSKNSIPIAPFRKSV